MKNELKALFLVLAAVAFPRFDSPAHCEDSSAHMGMDIASPEGAEVRTSDSGTVLSVKPFKRGEGQVTIGSIDGSVQLYVYVRPCVAAGQTVWAGEVIGHADTGAFTVKNIIHYGFRREPGGLFVDPALHLEPGMNRP